MFHSLDRINRIADSNDIPESRDIQVGGNDINHDLFIVDDQNFAVYDLLSTVEHAIRPIIGVQHASEIGNH